MGKMIGRGIPNILLFILYREVSHYGGRTKIDLIKFDIILMALKIPT